VFDDDLHKTAEEAATLLETGQKFDYSGDALPTVIITIIIIIIIIAPQGCSTY